eukprot:824715-Pleurochrysis_carterae.AAC.2
MHAPICKVAKRSAPVYSRLRGRILRFRRCFSTPVEVYMFLPSSISCFRLWQHPSSTLSSFNFAFVSVAGFPSCPFVCLYLHLCLRPHSLRCSSSWALSSSRASRERVRMSLRALVHSGGRLSSFVLVRTCACRPSRALPRFPMAFVSHGRSRWWDLLDRPLCVLCRHGLRHGHGTELIPSASTYDGGRREVGESYE